MKNKFSSSMFDDFKTVLQEQRSGGTFKDILKTPVGNSFRVRLIPNVNDVSKTIYHYYSHGWSSKSTGQYISCVCPITYGESCPICEERIRLYHGDNTDKENAKLLGKKEQWLVNVYVIDDPTKPDNNGKIKILRYGKQIDKKIMDAIDGIDKDEFGERIFDFTASGCDLRIVVEKNDGGYPSYNSSKFLRESAIKGLSEKELDSIYDNIFVLDKVFEAKTTAEVKEMLDQHYFCNISNSTTISNDSLGSTINTQSNKVTKVDETEQLNTNTIDDDTLSYLDDDDGEDDSINDTSDDTDKLEELISSMRVK